MSFVTLKWITVLGRIKSDVDKFEYCLKNQEKEVSAYHIKVNTPNKINGLTNGNKKNYHLNHVSLLENVKAKKF